MKPFGWIWVNYQKDIKPHFYETEHEAKNIQANWGGEVFSVYKAVVDVAPTPPQRKWVGLTDEEMKELWENKGWYVTMYKAVEAKLKEKNT